MDLAATGRGGRTLALRLPPGRDLVEGVLEACSRAGLRSAAVLTCLGSLRRFSFVFATLDPRSPCGVSYSAPTVVEGPLELICASGVLGEGEGGDLELHLHCCVSRGREVWAGHAVAGGSPVLITAEVILQELSGISMRRALDPQSPFKIFLPHQG